MVKASENRGPKRAKAKKSFYEIVFRGRPKVMRGFLAGLRLGAGGVGTVIYHYDAGIYTESRAERIAELVGIRRPDCHAVVDDVLCKLIRRRGPQFEQEANLGVDSCRHIRSAVLPFRYEVFAHRYRQEIDEVIANRPRAVRLVDFKTKEEMHPEAEGPEAYAPAHDFESRGTGKFVGRVDLVVELRQRFARYPLVELGDIELRLG